MRSGTNYASGQIAASFPHIESITQCAGEETNKVVKSAGGMSLMKWAMLTIYSNGLTKANFPCIENIILYAGKEIKNVAGNVGDMSLDGMWPLILVEKLLQVTPCIKHCM